MRRHSTDHYTRGYWLATLVFAVFTAGSQAIADGQVQTPSPTAAADALFARGNFQDAQAAYLAIWSLDHTNFQASKRLGALALYSNHLDEAQMYLHSALALKPDDPAASRLLAETEYRRDDFDQAAKEFRSAGNAPKADKLASFHGLVPYQIEGNAPSTALPFIAGASPETGDLPVVEARINGGRIARFLIDTGGGELVLDKALAQDCKATSFASTTGTFAGGDQAPVIEGRVDTVALGAFIVKNVPVQIIDLSGVKIDGVIGTVFLYHFLATLDYPGKQLILRRIGVKARQDRHQGVTVPFRMAGDHYMVAQGTVNGRGPQLFLVDTGLNGGGFAATPAQAALITKALKPTTRGIGGGGATSAIPFTVNSLTLGDAAQSNIQGLALDGLPETALGFHLDGLISHDFFKHYAVTFDFTAMRLTLTEADSPLPASR